MAIILVVTALSGIGILGVLLLLRARRLKMEEEEANNVEKREKEMGPVMKRIEEKIKDQLKDVVFEEFDIDAEFLGAGVKLKLRPRAPIDIDAR